MQHDGAWLAPG